MLVSGRAGWLCLPAIAGVPKGMVLVSQIRSGSCVCPEVTSAGGGILRWQAWSDLPGRTSPVARALSQGASCTASRALCCGGPAESLLGRHGAHRVGRGGREDLL